MGGGLRDALSGVSSATDAADAVCDHLLAMGMPMPSIYIAVAGRLRCVAQRGYWQVHDGVPPGVGVLGSTFLRGTSTVIDDVSRSSEFVAAGQDVCSEVTIPVRHDGRVIACINVESQVPLGTREVQQIEEAADELERCLDRIGGLPPLSPWQRLARESTALTQLRDLDDIVEQVVGGAVRLTALDSALLVLRDDGLGLLRPMAAHGPLAAVLEGLEPASIEAIGAWTDTGSSVYTFGEFPTSGFSGTRQIWDAGVQSLACAPVMQIGGRARGFLLVAGGEPSRPQTDEVQVLELFATHLASVLERADAFAALTVQASCDPLTGLGHGGTFQADLQEALAAGRTDMAVLLMDLDDFKRVNDTHGHLAGDRVLIETAQMLRSLLPPSDRAYRIGGDEFAAIVTASTGLRALEIAERLRAGAHRLGLTTASIGVRPRESVDDEAGSSDRILADADLALYDAKTSGRDRVARYRPSLREAVRRRARMSVELSEAICADALRVAYQPIIGLTSGRILGAEALVRWDHPTHGQMQPDAVIEVAEADGQIIDLGAWVIRQAIAQVGSWRQHTGADLHVAVNVSGTQLRSGFADTVAEALADADVPGDALVIEITESALVEGAERIAVLDALRTTGVRIAVDDFGTGFSSLSYLRRLPVDSLKIDQSFVAEISDPRNTAVVRAIIDLARDLELGCTAEGVETHAQAAALRELGCPDAQGYLFGRPEHPDSLRVLWDGQMA